MIVDMVLVIPLALRWRVWRNSIKIIVLLTIVLKLPSSFLRLLGHLVSSLHLVQALLPLYMMAADPLRRWESYRYFTWHGYDKFL